MMAKTHESRERLLQAAADLIWTSSYHATGVERICEVAEVNKGSFYHHFASKEELAIAAIEQQWSQLKPRVDGVFSPASPPLERLANYARLTVEMQREKQRETGCVCGCPLYALGSEMGSQAPALQRKIQSLLEVKLRYLVSAVREAHAAGEIVAPDPQRTAQLLMDVAEGVLMRTRIANDLAPLERLEETLFAVLGLPAKAPARA
jgi:TetR/AcrR family transcriptional regulator, transcriptional repressor for nem operon